MTLNSRTLKTLRNQTAAYLKDTCRIEVEGHTKDEFGGMEHGWIVVDTDVPCRVIMAGRSDIGKAALVGQRESLQDLYRIICPYGTPLASNQRITVGGVAYHVIQLVTARTDETDTQALITRQQ